MSDERPLLPAVTRDENDDDAGPTWYVAGSDAGADPDTERLSAERPPHYDRD